MLAIVNISKFDELSLIDKGKYGLFKDSMTRYSR